MSKGKADTVPNSQDLLLAYMRKHSPRGEEVIYEVSNTEDEILSKIEYVLTTGIPAFDDIIGGMPFGRIVEVFGLESCGKTALAIRCASRAKRGFVSRVIHDKDGAAAFEPLNPEDIDINVLYIDNERSLDDDSKVYVDGERLAVCTAYCDTVDMLFKQVEDSIDGMVAIQATLRAQVKGYNKIPFLVIVVDTIASTSNKQELAQEWGKVDYNRAPQQYSQGFRKMVRKVNANNVCLICTNQVRTNMRAQADAQRQGRQLSGNNAFEYTSYGGYALRYYASHRVFMHAMQSKYKLLPTAQFAAGINIGFYSAKNRLRMPFRDGRMVLLLDRDQGGINPLFSTLETLVLLRGITVTSKEKGTDFKCEFDRWAITPSTFDPVETETTLEEDDDKVYKRRGGRKPKKDLGFKYRANWPAFYAQHKADLDLLWTAVIKGAFTTDGLDGTLAAVEEEDAAVNPAMPELED